MNGNFINPRPLRYNITIRIAAFDRRVRRNIKKGVQEKMGVSDSTMSRWLHVRNDDKTDIPGLALLHFASYLNTTMEELFNDRNGAIKRRSNYIARK
jgi:transcriptional regulator with XRE-family HTH domain